MGEAERTGAHLWSAVSGDGQLRLRQRAPTRGCRGAHRGVQGSSPQGLQEHGQHWTPPRAFPVHPRSGAQRPAPIITGLLCHPHPSPKYLWSTHRKGEAPVPVSLCSSGADKNPGLHGKMQQLQVAANVREKIPTELEGVSRWGAEENKF